MFVRLWIEKHSRAKRNTELLNVVSAEGKELPVSRIHRISGQRGEVNHITLTGKTG